MEEKVLAEGLEKGTVGGRTSCSRYGRGDTRGLRPNHEDQPVLAAPGAWSSFSSEFKL